jgi:hypothetical protein
VAKLHEAVHAGKDVHVVLLNYKKVPLPGWYFDGAR